MPKYKKTNEESTPISDQYDLVTTTYTPDDKGENKFRIKKPVTIKTGKK